jgi:hypothetical protein
MSGSTRAQKDIDDFHDSLCGGYHFWRTTTYKILRAGFFGLAFLLMFVKRLELVSNAKSFLESNNSNICPLKPVVVSGPFQTVGS